MTAIAPANLPHLKSTFVTTLTEFKSTDVEGVGTIRIAGSAIYRWVKNACGEALVAGYAVSHDLLTDLHQLLAQVITPAADELVGFAGIAMSAIPEDYYGWIQIAGVYPTALIESTAAVVLGDSLKTVDGQYYLVHDAADGTKASQHRTALALKARGAAAGEHSDPILLMGLL